ncbi:MULTISPECIES: hypothetical protein [unclassified Streptomyces]|nr:MULTISPECIES: hypothetical protein [unclassified Streptomyces]
MLKAKILRSVFGVLGAAVLALLAVGVQADTEGRPERAAVAALADDSRWG